MGWRFAKSISLACCLAALLCTSLLGQLDVKSGVKTRIDATGITQIGDRIYLDTDSTMAGTTVGIVRVVSEASNIQIDVSDAARNPYTPTEIAKGIYEISQPGKWWVDVTAIDFLKNLYGRKSVVLEFGAGPGPKPPPPPGPGPAPSPDAPIDGLGLRVLIVHESSEANKLPGMVYGAKVRDYLNANCVRGPDGTPEWRMLDADTQYTDSSNKWAKALSRPRASTPWLIVSNGVSGSEGPLPTSIEELLLTIDQFAGKSIKKGESSVTMLSIDNCPYCTKFVDNESRNLAVTFYKKKGGSKIYPTFIVRHAGKESRLEGYRTADQLNNELKRLGALP